MCYIHQLSSKQVMICFYKHQKKKKLPKLHKGQRELGKRVEVTDTCTKEQSQTILRKRMCFRIENNCFKYCYTIHTDCNKVYEANLKSLHTESYAGSGAPEHTH